MCTPGWDVTVPGLGHYFATPQSGHQELGEAREQEQAFQSLQGQGVFLSPGEHRDTRVCSRGWETVAAPRSTGLLPVPGSRQFHEAHSSSHISPTAAGVSAVAAPNRLPLPSIPFPGKEDGLTDSLLIAQVMGGYF